MTTAADRDYQIADEITRLITVDTLTALQASGRIVLAPTATRDGGAVWSIQVLTPGGPARMAMRVELVGGTYAVTILRSGRKRSDPDGIFMHAPTVHADQLGPMIRQSVDTMTDQRDNHHGPTPHQPPPRKDRHMKLTDDQRAELRDEIAGTTIGIGHYDQMSIAVDEADEIVDYIAPLIERFIRDARFHA